MLSDPRKTHAADSFRRCFTIRDDRCDGAGQRRTATAAMHVPCLLVSARQVACRALIDSDRMHDVMHASFPSILVQCLIFHTHQDADVCHGEQHLCSAV
jgi:hypothetical protein